MFLRYLSIKNFRAIKEISAHFDKPINVIVGPNASGKTTVLEAIRLAKALLAPRTPNEPNQTLTALGAMSPHMPQRLIGDAIAQNQNTPTEIKQLMFCLMKQSLWKR
ncbi:MAG TPA: ATP-binding protein [Stellaceae bacterium]|jgi:recombinational DNA repair ATPase RecF|nr:ATP-binding protein [Stellaceae bacterium]